MSYTKTCTKKGYIQFKDYDFLCLQQQNYLVPIVPHDKNIPELGCKRTTGIVYFKNDSQFLIKPEMWQIIKLYDRQYYPSILYKMEGQYFYSQQYPNNKIDTSTYMDGINKCQIHLKADYLTSLINLSQKKFLNINFEKVIGFFLDYQQEHNHRLYYNCSGIPTLEDIFLKHDKRISNSNRLLHKIIYSFKEIDEKGINYVECFVANIRYDQNSNKLILNPHANIHFKEIDYWWPVSDLGSFIYYLKQIPNLSKHTKKNISTYFKKNYHRNRLSNSLQSDFAWLNSIGCDKKF